MDEVRKFISEMRQQQLSDDLIYKNLIQKGWDEQLVNEAFLPEGVVVPVPTDDQRATAMPASRLTSSEITEPKTEATSAKLDTAKAQTKFISGAQSALHHIFLWVFSIAFVVNIQIMIEAIIDGNFDDDFGKVLATSLSVLLITGAVYWTFYFKFVRNFKQNLALKLRAGWTVATLVIAGLGTIGSLIVLISSLIWTGQSENIIRILPMIIYGAAVVLTYAQINFAKPEAPLRRKLVQFWYVAAVVLIFMVSLVAAGLVYLDKKEDVQMKRDLAEIATKLAQDYRKTQQLPDGINQISNNRKITYREINQTKAQAEFELCGNFKYADYATSKRYYLSRNKITVYDDEPLRSSQFDVDKTGQSCYEIIVKSKNPNNYIMD